MTVRGTAVLVPGYGGTARQPILWALAAALDAIGVVERPIELSTRSSRPSKGYATELAEICAARDALRAEHPGRVALVGRSFGGRMCVFVAADDPPCEPERRAGGPSDREKDRRDDGAADRRHLERRDLRDDELPRDPRPAPRVPAARGARVA